MESTIYKAVATLFVEGSNSGLIIPFLSVLFGAVIGFLGSLIGAKKGAKKAYEYSRKLEEDRVQRDGRASLALLYVEINKNRKFFSDVITSLENLVDSSELKVFVFYVRHEDIHNVAKLDEQIGFSAVLCLKCLYEYQDYAVQYNKATHTTEDSKKAKWEEAQFEIKLIYANYDLEFKKIEKCYRFMKSQR